MATNDPIINAESQFGTVIAICVSFSVASVVFLGLRLYTRLHVLHHAGADDFTIVIAEVAMASLWAPRTATPKADMSAAQVLALLTALGAGMGRLFRWALQ